MNERHPYAVQVQMEREAQEAQARQEALEAGELLSQRLARARQEQEIEHLQSGADRTYATPQSTIDAYRYLRSFAPDRLAAWLENHALDAAFLQTLE